MSQGQELETVDADEAVMSAAAEEQQIRKMSSRWWHSLPVAINGTLMATLPFMRRVSGLRNVPVGPCILAANHSSLLDGPILTAWTSIVLARTVHSISMADAFNHWFYRWVLRSTRVIPLHRGKPESQELVMQYAYNYLRRGEIVGIFPEGKMVGGRKLRRLRTGAAFLALATGVPLVPVGLRGAGTVMALGKPVVWKRIVEMEIGEPIDTRAASEQYARMEAPGRAELADDLTRQLAERIGFLADMDVPKM